MFEFAANLTILFHLIFIIFVTFGAFLLMIKPGIVYLHLPSLFWGIYLVLTHSICPLTNLENWFLYKANLDTYQNGFIENYIVPTVYPTNLSDENQTIIGTLLIGLNIFIYGFVIYKYNKKNFKNQK